MKVKWRWVPEGGGEGCDDVVGWDAHNVSAGGTYSTTAQHHLLASIRSGIPESQVSRLLPLPRSMPNPTPLA